MESRIKDILLETKNVLSSKEKWAKHYYGFDDNNVMSDLENSVCFCLTGAVCKASGCDVYVNQEDLFVSDEEEDAVNTLLYLSRFLDDDNYIPTWNDDEDITYEDVIDLIDRGIEAL